ncbi:MAG: exodeoxyribonuclease VII large subunit [Deltaproteobacteria bacterium]|nr:MAG: exodeoxyribonuclease VII large subunit [Deltaproteobacteria bacterium]
MPKPSDIGMPLFDRLVDGELREDAPQPGDRDHPLSVSDAIQLAQRALKARIGTIWIEGEAVQVKRAASGHVYFCLQDGRDGRLNAVLWRADAARLRFALEEGQHLLCRGELGIYPAAGKLQFYAKAIEPAGIGAEALALEQLKRALAAEGLFDPARKRPLPRLPRRIGVVTSRSGAAVHDIVRVVHRRFPVPILVADAQVQGAAAPEQIVAALEAIVRHPVDVVIVGRGGGSAADLAAFNDERVVRAIAACPVPVISAVGHEVDVTLADLAADCRAATPSQAGELAVPVRDELVDALVKLERRLARELIVRVRDERQRIDRWTAAAQRAIATAVATRRRDLAELQRRVELHHPRARLERHRGEVRQLEAAAAAAFDRRRTAAGRDLAELAARLDALSPLRTLDRGYAIARAGDRVITDARSVAPGDGIGVVLARGRLDCTVEHVHEPEEDREPEPA